MRKGPSCETHSSGIFTVESPFAGYRLTQVGAFRRRDKPNPVANTPGLTLKADHPEFVEAVSLLVFPQLHFKCHNGVTFQNAEPIRDHKRRTGSPSVSHNGAKDCEYRKFLEHVIYPAEHSHIPLFAARKAGGKPAAGSPRPRRTLGAAGSVCS